MLQLKSAFKTRRFIFGWVVSIVMGWTLITYPGLILRSTVLSSWKMLLPIALQLLAFALLLGGIIGLLQYLLCRWDVVLSWQWILISAVSYGVGSSVAFLFSSAVLGISNPGIFSSGGASSTYMPLDFTMLFGGGLTTLMQAPPMRDVFFCNPKAVLSWILGVALSWEIGFFLAAYGWGANLPLFIQSGLAGLAISAGTALLLSIQMKTLRQVHKP